MVEHVAGVYCLRSRPLERSVSARLLLPRERAGFGASARLVRDGALACRFRLGVPFEDSRELASRLLRARASSDPEDGRDRA